MAGGKCIGIVLGHATVNSNSGAREIECHLRVGTRPHKLYKWHPISIPITFTTHVSEPRDQKI